MTILVYAKDSSQREHIASLIESWKNDHDGLIAGDTFGDHEIISTGFALSLQQCAQNKKPALIIAKLDSNLPEVISASKGACLAVISDSPRVRTGKSPEEEIRTLESISQSQVIAYDFLYEGSTSSIWRARLGKLLVKTALSPCKKITIGETELNKDQSTISVCGKPINLPRRELSVLWVLATRPGFLFTRPQIIDKVYGVGFTIADRAVDNTIKLLRAKLTALSLDSTSAIKTVNGMGYKASEDPAHWSRTPA